MHNLISPSARSPLAKANSEWSALEDLRIESLKVNQKREELATQSEPTLDTQNSTTHASND